MALRKIVKEGDEVLTKKCRPVEKFDDKLKILISDLIDTMKNADGLGLAAPQVGILRQIAVIYDGEEKAIVFINPVIIKTEGKQNAIEGCLSIPEVFGKTERPAVVTVKAQDVDGNFFEITREGITAVAFCHEIDHLYGHLFREKVIEYVERD